MSVNTGLFEYGKFTYFSVFTFFDILKNKVLEIENIVLSIVVSGLRQRIGFQTIPSNN
tara:strand:+ start:105 stop:278 length:174 start_codon:yes stop_codon:yes gene_type:complete